MSKKPTVHELEFLKLSANHAEFAGKLSSLGCPTPDIHQYAKHVCEAWFRLGEEHLAEAKQILTAGCRRAALSRAYDAAYNVSKGARYLVQGRVSLKGDDHGQATNLPDDLPDIAAWAGRITVLYENRLRADYDNWSTTTTDFSSTPADAVAVAEAFIDEIRTYLNSKHGMTL